MSTTTVDMAHDIAVGNTTTFPGQSWNMQWKPDDYSAILKISEDFEVGWEDPKNRIHDEHLSEWDNYRMNAYNQIVGQLSLETYKYVQSRTTATIKELLATDNYHILPTDTTLPTNQSSIDFEDGSQIKKVFFSTE